MQDEEMVTQLPRMLYGEDERVTLLRQILKAMGQPDHAFRLFMCAERMARAQRVR